MSEIDPAAALERAIEMCDDKLQNGRIRNPEHEQVRTKYVHALVSAVNALGKWQERQKIQELAEKIEEIDERTKERETPAFALRSDGGRR